MTGDDLATESLSPHGDAIGMRVDEHGGGRCRIRVPYAEHLIGDPDSGVMHGGVITAALDNASGWSIRTHPECGGESMATLDLRIDYMRPARPHEDLLVEAECYKVARAVAFVRGVAHQGDAGDPVATSTATFMLGTPNTPRRDAPSQASGGRS